MISSHCTYVLWVAWKFLSGQVTCRPRCWKRNQVSFGFRQSIPNGRAFIDCDASLSFYKAQRGTESTKHPKTSGKIQHIIVSKIFDMSWSMKRHDEMTWWCIPMREPNLIVERDWQVLNSSYEDAREFFEDIKHKIQSKCTRSFWTHAM